VRRRKEAKIQIEHEKIRKRKKNTKIDKDI
jgi:hypothetical protein